MEEIPISRIEGIRTRLDPPVHIDDILRSLAKQGQFSPIRVRKHTSKAGMYEVIFGNRRLAAARTLGWKTILADVVEASDTDALIMAFSENDDREDFTDYEKASLIERLHLLLGKNYSEIAEILGKSPSYVSQHLAMLHLFPKGIASDEESKIVLQQLTEKHARALLKIEDPAERWTAAKLAIKASMGAREIERMVGNAHRRSFRPDSSASHVRVRQIIKAHIEALNTKDMASYFGAISNSHFSKFSYFPPLSRLDSVASKEHLFEMFHDLKGYRASIDTIDSRVVGKIAYATVTLSNQYSSSARTVTAETRLTIILEKERDDWRIVHEHWSTASPTRFLSLFTNKEIPNFLIGRRLNSVK